MFTNRVRVAAAAVSLGATAALLAVAAPSPASPVVVVQNDWVDIAARPFDGGYWVVAEDGTVRAFGDATSYGDASGLPLRQPIVGIVPTFSGQGYWLAAADGGVFSYGDAPFLGSAANLPLSAPISAIDRTPTGNGYRLLGEDGGVFAFGDATYLGRLPTASSRATALASTPYGEGYLAMRGSDGPHNFGNSAVATAIGVSHGDPYVDVAGTPWLTGVWMTSKDGTVNVMGEGAVHHGDASGFPLQAPITANEITSDGRGYWMLGEDGGVFAFGNARFFGRP